MDFIRVPHVDHHILIEKCLQNPLAMEDMHLDKVESWVLGLLDSHKTKYAVINITR
jgi:hypothetical protein